MIAKIAPSPLFGAVRAIASKSEAHRNLILASLSEGKTEFELHGGSDDIDATIECIKALGAKVEKTEKGFIVTGGETPGKCCLNARESGSTLRFLLPVAAAKCRNVSFTGSGRLPERPLTHLVNALRENGVSFSCDKLPLTMTGCLKSGVYTVPGNISSQYVTGLLMALPLLEGDSEIRIEGTLASKAYVDITLNTLSTFSVSVVPTDFGYRIPGGQTPVSPGGIFIEGDWSNAAFFLAAGAIGKDKVTVTGINPASFQGDKAIIPLLERFGAKIEKNRYDFTVKGGSLSGTEIDIGEVPDLIAPLGVTAAFAEGKTVFYNAGRLRLKESDRIESMKSLILSLGGKAESEEDKLIVYGNGNLPGGECKSDNDHRIAMAAAVAGAYSENGCVISGAEAVNKSYPGFFGDFITLGGKADVL